MRSRTIVLFAVIIILTSQVALATITFTQLDDDIFMVSHRIKVIGSRGKAMKMVYLKTSSLCIAAGFTHYKILDQESGAAQQYESANASVQVQFFQEDDDGRIGCERNADPKYVDQARKKLVKKGYKPPSKNADD